MDINDILLDEELNELVEDYENDVNFMSQEINYEVWALGYDANDEITDAELCMFTSTDPEEAIEYAKKVELADIVNLSGNGPCTNNNVLKIYVEVESTVQVDDDFVNVGTVYRKEVMNNTVDYEPDNEDDDCEIINLISTDYSILEDNTLKVKREALLGFNKNDLVTVCLMGNDLEAFPLVYKIMSTVVYEDGDYYHCELEY